MQGWEEGGTGITTRDLQCLVVCGLWERSPCGNGWLDSPVVLCWPSLDSRNTRENWYMLLAPFLQFPNMVYPMCSEEQCINKKPPIRLEYQRAPG